LMGPPRCQADACLLGVDSSRKTAEVGNEGLVDGEHSFQP